MAAVLHGGRLLAGPSINAAAPAASRQRGSSRRAATVQAAVRQAAPQAPAIDAPPPEALRLHTPTVIAAAAVAAAAAYFWRRIDRRLKAGPLEYPGMAGLVRPAQTGGPSELDAEYRMALARTRQATAIHRAVGFLNTGDRARAYVEVRRALHQNSVCRAPLLNPGHSKGELVELYRLHLQQSETPADFGTLLQLRALLDLDFEESERVEREMDAESSFSI